MIVHRHVAVDLWKFVDRDGLERVVFMEVYREGIQRDDELAGLTATMQQRFRETTWCLLCIQLLRDAAVDHIARVCGESASAIQSLEKRG